MNRFLKIFISATVVLMTACNADPIENKSVIDDPSSEKNSFDCWLDANYVYPYNIEFLYKMEDIESSMSYTLIPADYKKSTQMARIVKHLCMEVYDEVTGSREFMCRYFPKMFHIIGSAAYNNDGTIVLGTAEGGLKITLYMVNSVDITDIDMLNYYYFHTIHHEFAHILHQNKPYSTEYQDISGSNYVQDSWQYNVDYLSQGFISAYSSKEPNEDFVEIISRYLTNTQAWWDSQSSAAGADGAAKITRKWNICYEYMLAKWNIDLVKMRSIIQRRSSELPLLGLDNEL